MPRISIELTDDQYNSWLKFTKYFGFETVDDFVKRAVFTYILAKKNQLEKNLGEKIKIQLQNKELSEA